MFTFATYMLNHTAYRKTVAKDKRLRQPFKV